MVPSGRGLARYGRQLAAFFPVVAGSERIWCGSLLRFDLSKKLDSNGVAIQGWNLMDSERAEPCRAIFHVELDAQRAETGGRLLAPHCNVEVISGDWHEILKHGPFAMMFPDGGQAKMKEPQTVINAVRPGGLIVLDDLTRGEPVQGGDPPARILVELS